MDVRFLDSVAYSLGIKNVLFTGARVEFGSLFYLAPPVKKSTALHTFSMPGRKRTKGVRSGREGREKRVSDPTVWVTSDS